MFVHAVDILNKDLYPLPSATNGCSFATSYGIHVFTYQHWDWDTVGLNIVRVLGYYLQQEVKDDIIPYHLYQFK